MTWLKTAELQTYLQQLLNQGYYLVFDQSPDYTAILPLLNYNQKSNFEDIVIVWKK